MDLIVRFLDYLLDISMDSIVGSLVDIFRFGLLLFRGFVNYLKVRNMRL